MAALLIVQRSNLDRFPDQPVFRNQAAFGGLKPSKALLGRDVAGLTIMATTPQQQQHLKTLTPDKMTTVHRNGKTYYVYADPTKMQIYVGTQAENKRYQQLRKANNLAEEKSYSEAMGDWGPWEPFGY
jgi:hypothetical protein